MAVAASISETTTPRAKESPHAPSRPCRPDRIKKRRDFLAAAKARKWATPGFILQGRRRAKAEDAIGPRVGFTASKKVGNAVARNRAKRRLRAIADLLIGPAGRADWDYVLIARAEGTNARAFSDLKADLETAMARVHAQKNHSQKTDAQKKRAQKSSEPGPPSTSPRQRREGRQTVPPDAAERSS